MCVNSVTHMSQNRDPHRMHGDTTRGLGNGRSRMCKSVERLTRSGHAIYWREWSEISPYKRPNRRWRLRRERLLIIQPASQQVGAFPDNESHQAPSHVAFL